MNTIEKLQKQTAQYAIEHITGKGMHTGFAWFRDSFNELCEAMGANEFDPEDIGFELDDLVENLKKAPWVAEIAGKPANSRTTEDIDRVVNSFRRRIESSRSPEQASPHRPEGGHRLHSRAQSRAVAPSRCYPE